MIRELFSTVRHHLKYYTGVAITARYLIDGIDAPFDLDTALKTALAELVFQHPALCCCIIGEDTNTASYQHYEWLDLSKHIEYKYVATEDTKSYDEILLEIIERQHDTFWPDLANQPGWKIIVVQDKDPSASSGSIELDVIFAYQYVVQLQYLPVHIIISTTNSYTVTP